ncbi:MAG: hypothetical protein NTW87_09980 [Planctomycetota bacterium]|nr:hypothetical protein [Planctomycetota bacterium]
MLCKTSDRRGPYLFVLVTALLSTTVCTLAFGAASGPADGSLLRKMLADPQANCSDIVFAVRPHSEGHWYENFGGCDAKRINWHDGTCLCRLHLPTGTVTTILDDPQGGIRDPQVSYDATTILFSYRKAETEHYRLYEIKVDGAGLKQLTPDDGPHDDIEPLYLPGGGIVFGSSRVHRQVPCWFTEAAILHSCGADGSNIHPISANVEHENTPCMLPDGRILYMRWEYVDRHEGAYHHLWTVNPDGTNAMVYYGNQWGGGVYLDAQAVPGTHKVLFVDSPGHGVSDHYGFLTLLGGNGDPDDRKRASRIGVRAGARRAPKDVKGEGLWGRDPYPLSDKWFLYADGEGLHLATFEGETELVHSLPPDQAKALQHGGKLKGKELALECHEPRPLRPRPREPVIPDRVDWSKTSGCLVLADVLNGRNMAGVKPGEIKKIQVLEILPKPCDSNDVNMERPDRTYRFLKRALGDFPVEPDGSAYVELPAMRALQFVALDEHSRSVKHMLSFVSLMPGEVLSCAGCHESRTQAVRCGAQTSSVRRPASRLETVAGMPDILDFPRDIQPVLDRHCDKCHNADDQAGHVDLSGDRGTWRSFGFINLVRNGRASINFSSAGNRPPHSYGSGASPILRLFDPSHENVKLSETELRLLQTWLDAGVTYRGAYIAAPHQSSAGKADEVLANRCAQCHRKDGKGTEKEKAKQEFWLARFGDERLGIMPRALLFNLTRPEKSLALRAPLAKDAGGLGWCRTASGTPVFAATNDTDYQTLMSELTKGHEVALKAEAQALGGNAGEKLKLYGLLPPAFDPRRDPIGSVFDLERRYYEMTYPRLRLGP